MINKITPPKENPVKSSKPNVPTTAQYLHGYIANSINAGHNKTIAYIPIMAGQKIYQYAPKLRISLLTPKTPAYQKLFGKLELYFVPNTRVMKDWENFEAQIKNETEITIQEEPNFGGKLIPNMQWANEDQGEHADPVLLTNTTAWRDSWISSYIPRVGYFGDNLYGDFVMPKYSALPARGMVAIYNDFLRDKRYDERKMEFNGNTVTEEEWQSYIPKTITDWAYTSMRARRSDNYYTDYRTQYQGLTEEEAPDLSELNNNLVTWASWEAKIAEARSQAEHENSNPWTRIAEIRGSQAAYQGKVQKISQKTFEINYSAITQNAYNTNSEIEEQFQVMGKQGAYSYTEIMMPLLAGWEAIESGYIHVIFNVYAENAFETGFERTGLNVNAMDKYRPDLKDDKLDVLYEIETNGNAPKDSIIGYKRKYSEYFKLPNVLSGDLMTNNYLDTEIADINNDAIPDKQVITQKTYTFFEIDRDGTQGINFPAAGGQDNPYVFYKTPWKDYSDFQLNKNQAIMNKVEQVNGPDTEVGGAQFDLHIMGQNQIIFVGEQVMYTELPIDEAIATNYTKWGEH